MKNKAYRSLLGLLFASILSIMLLLQQVLIDAPLGRVNSIQQKRASVAAICAKDPSEDLLVHPTDKLLIYQPPIVVESHKLIFFQVAKVASTTFHLLLRRMMGYDDWNLQNLTMPHHPGFNGLKYLDKYEIDQIHHFMTDSEWTKAIFVRDPVERFLSAYYNKVKNKPAYIKMVCKRCRSSRDDCIDGSLESPDYFLEHVVKVCSDVHWNPIHLRMEEKYWWHINFVGTMPNLAADTEHLLRQIGAWEDYGASGWGDDGKDAIFMAKKGGEGRRAATNAQNDSKTMDPVLLAKLKVFYNEDYKLGFFLIKNPQQINPGPYPRVSSVALSACTGIVSTLETSHANNQNQRNRHHKQSSHIFAAETFHAEKSWLRCHIYKHVCHCFHIGNIPC